MFRAIFKLLNRDLTGRTWQREVPHSHFQNLVHFGNKDSTRDYWEADVPVAGSRTLTVYMKGVSTTPAAEHEDYCRRIAAAPESLEIECQPVVAAEVHRNSDGIGPPISVVLESIEVPENFDTRRDWEASFSVPGHDGIYTVTYELGVPAYVRFDD